VIAPLLVTEDAVYFGNESDDHTKVPSFFALDKLTGKEKWSVDMIGSIIGSPAVSKNIVVFATYGGFVNAYDRDTGLKQWNYAHPQDPSSKCDCGWNWTSPVISGNMVFIGNSDQKLYAFDLNTGHIQWSYKTDGGIDSSPLVVNKRVIVGSSNAILYQLDEITGKEISKWQIPIFLSKGQNPDNAGEIEQQIYDLGIIYLYNGSLMAIDANTGQVIWHLGRENQIELYGPIRVGNDLVYIRSMDDKLIAINKKKGNIVWEGKTQDVLSDLALIGGKIYYGDYDGHINVIDAENGQKIDQYDMHLFDPMSKFQSDANFDNSPSVVDKIAYLG
jgi:outer membrane protein assembly factor BamB